MAETQKQKEERLMEEKRRKAGLVELPGVGATAPEVGKVAGGSEIKGVMGRLAILESRVDQIENVVDDLWSTRADTLKSREAFTDSLDDPRLLPPLVRHDAGGLRYYAAAALACLPQPFVFGQEAHVAEMAFTLAEAMVKEEEKRLNSSRKGGQLQGDGDKIGDGSSAGGFDRLTARKQESRKGDAS